MDTAKACAPMGGLLRHDSRRWTMCNASSHPPTVILGGALVGKRDRFYASGAQQCDCGVELWKETGVVSELPLATANHSGDVTFTS